MTIPHIHPTCIPYLLQHRATHAKHHATMTCSCADVPNAKQHSHVILLGCFFPIQISQRKPFISSLHFLGIPGNSLSIKIRNAATKKLPIVSIFKPQRVLLCTGCPRLLHQRRSPVARLVSSHVGSRFNSAGNSRVVSSSRHVRPRHPASRSSGRRFKLSFRQAVLGFPRHLDDGLAMEEPAMKERLGRHPKKHHVF